MTRPYGVYQVAASSPRQAHQWVGPSGGLRIVADSDSKFQRTYPISRAHRPDLALCTSETQIPTPFCAVPQGWVPILAQQGWGTDGPSELSSVLSVPHPAPAPKDGAPTTRGRGNNKEGASRTHPTRLRLRRRMGYPRIVAEFRRHAATRYGVMSNPNDLSRIVSSRR